MFSLIGLPFAGLAFVFINENFLEEPFSERIEFFIFMMCLGITLAASGLALLQVNKNKDSNFVSSAPYAGKLEGLSKRQALFGNWALIILGGATIAAALYVLIFG
jgi:hypothetical protein